MVSCKFLFGIEQAAASPSAQPEFLSATCFYFQGGYYSKEDLYNCFKTTIEALNLLYSTYGNLTTNGK
jgi:hypothetical protein